MPSNSETTPDTGARWLRGSISSACPPIVSVFVLLLGAVALVLTPLEKLLYQSDGVKYVYSQSLPGRSVVTVRFYVGEDREASLVKIYNKIQSNIDAVPPGVDAWVIKPVEVDDVPIVVAALWRDDPGHIDDHGLRRMADQHRAMLIFSWGCSLTAAMCCVSFWLKQRRDALFRDGTLGLMACYAFVYLTFFAYLRQLVPSHPPVRYEGYSCCYGYDSYYGY